MTGNPLRDKLAAGEPAFGGWLSIPDSFAAELMAHAGFDWLLIDMQHGLVDYAAMVPMLQAISTTSTLPLVRPPTNEAGIIGRALDAGARGVIVPMVNTPEAAEAAVSACRYAPTGTRSFGPVRASLDLGVSLFEFSDADALCIVMLETVQAFEHLDEILSVPGLDGAFIGPADLSVSFGLSPGVDHEDERFNDAVTNLVEGCRRRGIAAGIYANSATGRQRADQGFTIIQIADDIALLSSAAQEALQAVTRE